MSTASNFILLANKTDRTSESNLLSARNQNQIAVETNHNKTSFHFDMAEAPYEKSKIS